jgi:hypothetical protein
LEYATEKSIENDQFERGEDKENAVEKDPIFSKRYAEDTRILARGDHIAVREALNVTEERRALLYVLTDIQRIGKTGKSED